VLTGGNRNDITQMLPLVEAIPPVRGRRGRRRRRPRKLYGDRAYHSCQGRRELRRRGIQARIAWLHQYRRLRVRYERRDDIHEAFLAIGCSLICLKLLPSRRVILIGALTWSKRSRGAARLVGCPLGLEQRMALGSDGGSD